MIDKQMSILIEAAKRDDDYQRLLQECRELGEEYERICAMLSDTDRELLDRYISACENMEYR